MPTCQTIKSEREFWSRQIHFTASDCETLYWLVEESGMNEEQKLRLTNKLKGYFVSPRTQALSKKLLAKRAREARKR